jgi:ornithine cyclodeaminase
MLILNASDVRTALPMPSAIDAMKQAFAAFSDGKAVVPPRIHLPIARHSGISLIMPSFVDAAATSKQTLAVKVVSLFDGNQARGLARIQAAVLVFEPDTGRPIALLDGAMLTAIRTAAASGAATDLLARRDCRTVALFGAGVQAITHLFAMCSVRPIERIFVCGRTPSKVATLIAEFSGRPAITAELIAADSPQQALADADIVCCTTTSKTPIFDDADLKPGVHMNAVGSYTPQAREVPPETVRRALVVVDSRHAAWEEAGDLIQPMQAGLIGREHIHAELGELVVGRKAGRADDRQITFFKSVGLAVQDAVAARVALENAARMKLGQEVAW